MSPIGSVASCDHHPAAPFKPIAAPDNKSHFEEIEEALS